MEICLIWAQDCVGAIGRENTLPWRLPEDLRRFKELTEGSSVIMGRKTFESLPAGPLPHRQNIVMSRTPSQDASGAVFVSSLEQGLQLAATAKPARTFVIGGAEVYRQALKVADALYVTRVDVLVEKADAFAPAVPPEFLLTESSDWLESKAGLKHRFEVYRKGR